MKNIDSLTVKDFGEEWGHYDQSELKEAERKKYFDQYFSIFPWEKITKDAVGFDAGCGSGRWAMEMAPRVKSLHCVDASIQALNVAKNNLANAKNCFFHNNILEEMPITDATMDFGYSLGVLHHIPNTEEALKACTRKLKSGAPFLVYLYYRFDNRPIWFVLVWRISDLVRVAISKLPTPLKLLVCKLIALTIYFPFARLAKIVSGLGVNVGHFPLSAYKDRSFYVMQTDALDRFGTRLEQRFTKKEITVMMQNAGLEQIRFRNDTPFWCAVGLKK